MVNSPGRDTFLLGSFSLSKFVHRNVKKIGDKKPTETKQKRNKKVGIIQNSEDARISTLNVYCSARDSTADCWQVRRSIRAAVAKQTEAGERKTVS